MSGVVRVAAIGDIHAAEPLRDHIASTFERIGESADLALLAGDLTTQGLPEQALVLADACRPLTIPVLAVLGNHDHHSQCSQEVTRTLEDGGIRVLDREAAVVAVDGTEVGIVGVKGFVGGFEGGEIPDFGESLLREMYRETSRDVEALEAGLEEIAGCQRRIVLMHYAPLSETLIGEPERIWAFLGSSRLAAPIGAHRPDLVVHGHAHRGTHEGSIGEVRVLNVAVHVLGDDFALVTL